MQPPRRTPLARTCSKSLVIQVVSSLKPKTSRSRCWNPFSHKMRRSLRAVKTTTSKRSETSTLKSSSKILGLLTCCSSLKQGYGFPPNFNSPGNQFQRQQMGGRRFNSGGTADGSFSRDNSQLAPQAPKESQQLLTPEL